MCSTLFLVSRQQTVVASSENYQLRENKTWIRCDHPYLPTSRHPTTIFFERVFMATGGHIYVQRRGRVGILKSAVMRTGNPESLSSPNIIRRLPPLLTRSSKTTALTRSAPRRS